MEKVVKTKLGVMISILWLQAESTITKYFDLSIRKI